MVVGVGVMTWLIPLPIGIMGCWMIIWPDRASARAYQKWRAIGAEPAPPGPGTHLFFRIQGIGMFMIALLTAYQTFPE